MSAAFGNWGSEDISKAMPKMGKEEKKHRVKGVGYGVGGAAATGIGLHQGYKAIDTAEDAHSTAMTSQFHESHAQRQLQRAHDANRSGRWLKSNPPPAIAQEAGRHHGQALKYGQKAADLARASVKQGRRGYAGMGVGAALTGASLYHGAKADDLKAKRARKASLNKAATAYAGQKIAAGGPAAARAGGKVKGKLNQISHAGFSLNSVGRGTSSATKKVTGAITGVMDKHPNLTGLAVTGGVGTAGYKTAQKHGRKQAEKNVSKAVDPGTLKRIAAAKPGKTVALLGTLATAGGGGAIAGNHSNRKKMTVKKSAFGVEDDRDLVEKFAMPNIGGMLKPLGAKAVTGTTRLGNSMARGGAGMSRMGAKSAGRATGAVGTTAGAGAAGLGNGIRRTGTAVAAHPKAALSVTGGTAGGFGLGASKPKQQR